MAVSTAGDGEHGWDEEWRGRLPHVPRAAEGGRRLEERQATSRLLDACAAGDLRAGLRALFDGAHPALPAHRQADGEVASPHSVPLHASKVRLKSALYSAASGAEVTRRLQLHCAMLDALAVPAPSDPALHVPAWAGGGEAEVVQVGGRAARMAAKHHLHPMATWDWKDQQERGDAGEVPLESAAFDSRYLDGRFVLDVVAHIVPRMLALGMWRSALDTCFAALAACLHAEEVAEREREERDDWADPTVAVAAVQVDLFGGPCPAAAWVEGAGGTADAPTAGTRGRGLLDAVSELVAAVMSGAAARRCVALVEARCADAWNRKWSAPRVGVACMHAMHFHCPAAVLTALRHPLVWTALVSLASAQGELDAERAALLRLERSPFDPVPPALSDDGERRADVAAETFVGCVPPHSVSPEWWWTGPAAVAECAIQCALNFQHLGAAFRAAGLQLLREVRCALLTGRCGPCVPPTRFTAVLNRLSFACLSECVSRWRQAARASLPPLDRDKPLSDSPHGGAHPAAGRLDGAAWWELRRLAGLLDAAAALVSTGETEGRANGVQGSGGAVSWLGGCALAAACCSPKRFPLALWAVSRSSDLAASLQVAPPPDHHALECSLQEREAPWRAVVRRIRGGDVQSWQGYNFLPPSHADLAATVAAAWLVMREAAWRRRAVAVVGLSCTDG